MTIIKRIITAENDSLTFREQNKEIKSEMLRRF